MSNDTLLAIPFFTFMGLVLERSGMAEDLLDTIGQLFGPMRGGQFFFGTRAFFLAVGVADQAHQESDALDQFGNALQGEQRKADGQQDFYRPADQATGVGRVLVDLVGLSGTER
jgi:hypothetical protein